MAKKPGKLSAMQDRAAKAATAVGVPTAAEPAPKKSVSIGQFVREVRAEMRKISWPSRQETWITSVMVLIMVVVASLFFGALDLVLGLAINEILKLA